MSSYISNIIDLSNIITSFRYNEKKTDSQVLDPFSCLIRLCLLNYKPIGTKLSFTNNKIVFQEPDFLQSAKRWSSGDSRQHIHNLYNPIFKLNQWYNINTPQFIYLLNKSKSGLNQLLKCYNKNDSNLISHSINYYIETIDKTLQKKINYDEQLLHKSNNNKHNNDSSMYEISLDNNEINNEKINETKFNNNEEKINEENNNNNSNNNNNNKKNKKKNKFNNTTNSIENNNIIDEITPYQDNIINTTDTEDTNLLNNLLETTDIYSIKLKNLWNLDEINIIYLLLLEIEKKYTIDKFNNSQSLIMCVEEILYGKDEILNTIVNKIATSL
jgi:hypothetical protein